MRLHCVTLNTGFDETIRVRAPASGEAGALISRTSTPSGKGVNAARAARVLGVERVTAYGLVGAVDREDFAGALAAEGLDNCLVPLEQPTRRNLTLETVGSESPALHFRAEGFTLPSRAPLQDLAERLVAAIEPGDVVSLHGSVPHGAPDDAWLDLARQARSTGARVCGDVAGAPLLRLLSLGSMALLKPNRVEAQALGAANDWRRDGPVLLGRLASMGVARPAISWGPAGLLALHERRAWRISCPARPRVLVGAGDVLMAALLAAIAGRDRDFLDGARGAVAAATAHVEGCGLGELRAGAEQALRRTVVEDLGPVT